MNRHDHDHPGHGHSHDMSGLSGKKIFWAALLNGAITVAQIAGGLLSGSLALLSDAVHNLSDTAAIALSYFANMIAGRPRDSKRTFGYRRAEILTAFVNSTVLFAVSLFLIFEAFRRIRSPQGIDGTIMIAVALIDLVADFVSVVLLKRDSHENLNIKSSYLHLIGDTAASVGVLAGGLAIRFWGVVWIDPLITVAISLYILRETWRVIKRTVGILMQSSAALDYNAVKRDVEKIDRVRNLHHVHTWMVDEKTVHFEGHVEMDDMMLSEAEKIYDQIERLLVEKYGVCHVTIQAEVCRCCDKRMFKV